MTKPACLSLSILELAKIVMYEFWYDYIKPGYEKKKKNQNKVMLHLRRHCTGF